MKAGTALAAVVAVAAIAPATAAAQRYASPGATPVNACSAADPCDFKTAVEGASDGEEVVVLPGVHTPVGEVLLDTASFVHGLDDQPAPLIVSTAGTAISVTNPGAELRRLEVSHFGAGDGILLDAGTARRLVVRSTGVGFACHVRGATLQDSVCWAEDGGSAVGMETAGTVDQSTLYNVTAYGSGPGSRGLRVAAGPSSFADLVALNVIARGALDTEVTSTANSVGVVNLDYSNFATQSLSGPNSHASAPGLARNQVPPPVFANAAAGDFHQDPDSPTVDRGTFDIPAGDADVDGEARLSGFGIDIGADELPVGPAPPDTNPPETKILKKPPRRTKKRKANFKFGTTEPVNAQFWCSLDGKAYKRCKSPEKMRVKRGKRHKFAVFSIDEAGNVDPTPAQYRWKVKKKRDRGGGDLRK